MASILDYLQGGSLGQSYIAEDPYWQAGRAIQGIQTTAPRNNTEAFLLPFLQNAIGGTLAGYGKNSSAPDTLFKDIQGSSFGEYMPQQYTTPPEGTSIESLLTSQGMPGERPDNLSMKQMSNDLLFASKAKEVAIEQEAKKQEIRDTLEKSILLEGVKNKTISIKDALAASGGETDLENIPEPTENTAWWEAVPAADKQKLTQAKGVVGQLDKLAQDFESAGMTAAEFIAKQDVSGTKANQLKSRMMTLIPNTVRLMGDVGNLAEGEQKRVIDATLGNWTSGTEGAAQRIRNLADQSQGIMEAKMGGYKAAQTNPSTLLERGVPQSTQLKKSMAPPAPLPGETREQYKARVRGG